MEGKRRIKNRKRPKEDHVCDEREMINRKKLKEDKGSDEPSSAKEVTSRFSLNSFQKKLKSEECHKALEEFIHLCHATKGKNSPAGIFLKNGGKIMEILNILNGGHCKNLPEVSAVFKVLHILLLRIQTEVHEQLTSAEEMCHQLVNNHLHQIHSMLLTKSAARFKKVVLQLLTAVITMNENLAKNIMSHVSLSIEVVDDIVRMAVPDDKQSVRICYIHFLMAFLVEGSPSIIRLLLKQRIMLTSIVPGLVYDFFDVVVFVLTTLRTKIVENMSISKTDKLHTFNTRVLLGLMALYNWKGPGAFVSKWKEDTQKDLDTVVNKEQQHAVAEATHSLLLSLCTSFRHGIVFKDRSLGTSSIKQNTLLVTLIKEMKAPWDHKFLAELAIAIVKVCPELAPMFYSKMAKIFQPRASDAWKRVVHFATAIISSLSLTDLATLDPESACKLAIGLVGPTHLLNSVAVAGLVHDNAAVRLKTVEFLQAILKATESALSVLKTEESAKFNQHIMKFLPDAVVLEKSWSLSFATNGKVSGSVPSPSCNQQMCALVNLMLLYQNHFMVLLDIEKKHESLAHSLAKCLDMDNSKDENFLDTQIKVLELLTQMDTPVLEPGKVGFLGAINVTLQANSVARLSSIPAQTALGNLLVKCGVLESASADVTDELGIWIHCYQSAELIHHSKIHTFLQEVLMIVSASPSQFIEQILEIQQKTFNSTIARKVKKVTHIGLVDQLFQELLSVGKEISSNDFLSNDENITKKHYGDNELNNVYAYGISSLLICALDVVTSRNELELSIKKYLCNVLVHLLHKQSDPKPFLSITERWVSLPASVAKYMYSWLEDQPLPLSDPFGYYSPECSVSRFLLQPNRVVPTLEDSSDLAVILLRARLVCFHIVQLCERDHLTEIITQGGSDMMTALLQSLVSISDKDSQLFKKYALKFLNIVFKHPSLVCYFSPLHRKKKQNEKLVTNFLLNFLEEVNCHQHIFENKSFADLLKEKLLRNIAHFLEKSEKVPTKSDTLCMSVKLLSLTDSDMCNLISKVKEHMMADPWMDLFVYLLQNVNNLSSSEVNSLGCILRDEMKKKEPTDYEKIWIVCDALYQYLEKFPHRILHLPDGLFQELICKNHLNLASLMLQHHETCTANFLKLIEQEESAVFLFPDVLGHLLSIVSKQSIPFSTLKILYSKYEQDILESLQSPSSIPKVFSEHHLIVKPLICQCMDVELCKTLSLSLENNSEGLGLFSPFHLSVIEGLKNRGGWQGKPESFLKLLLQQMIQMLQHEVPAEHVIQLCTLLVQHLEDENNKWDCVTPDEAWAVIPALFLRTAMKESNRTLSGSILLVLSKLLMKVKAIKLSEVVFEMMISHSRFLDLILIRDQDDLKLGLLKLVLVCYQLSPKLMKAVHIPVWLGAYGASLSHCDQIILKILHSVNDNKNVSLHAFRPFLWGDAAVNHYTIRSQARMSLWRIPQATIALELLDLEKVENTIAKFPIFRHLFLNEIQDECRKRKNDYKMSSVNENSENLEPCQPEIYDPAFLLPVFSHLMAPESVVQDYKFIQLGGLAVTLASLGSTCKHIRAASLSVISRFYSRLNGKRPSVQLMKLFIEALRAGIIEIKDNQRQRASEFQQSTTSETDKSFSRTKNNVGNNEEDEEEETEAEEEDSDDSTEKTSNDKFEWALRLSNLSSVFIARASLVLVNPSHDLYNPLYKFLLARSALKLYSIPELKSLSRPNSLNFRSHQHWLLETVRCGMRTQRDVNVAKKSYLFKIIFSLFSSSLSDSSIRILILQIVEATLKIYNGTHTLIQCGLKPWLYSSFILVCDEKDGNLVVAFIRIIVSLRTGLSSFVPVVNVSPLLFYLPLFMESSDLLCILRMVQSSILHVSKKHLIIVLRCCFPVLGQAVVEASARQLDIPLCDIAWKVNILENESDGKKINVSKSRDISELNVTLQSIVHAWLTHSPVRND